MKYPIPDDIPTKDRPSALKFKPVPECPSVMCAVCEHCNVSISYGPNDPFGEHTRQRYHRDECDRERFRIAMVAAGYEGESDFSYTKTCRRAGVDLYPDPWGIRFHWESPVTWVPKWAAAVCNSRASWQQKVCLLKRLANDPVAAQLVVAHPESIAQLMRKP